MNHGSVLGKKFVEWEKKKKRKYKIKGEMNTVYFFYLRKFPHVSQLASYLPRSVLFSTFKFSFPRVQLQP